MQSMIDLQRNMLEKFFAATPDRKGLVVVPKDTDEAASARRATGTFYIPDSMIPSNSHVIRIPLDENYLNSLQREIENSHPDWIFIFPSLEPNDALIPGDMRKRFGRLIPDDMVLLEALASLPAGCLVGLFTTPGLLGGDAKRDLRRFIYETARPKLVISHDHECGLFGWNNIHQSFRVATLFLEVGGQSPDIRFFKVLPTASEQLQDVLGDFERLMRQGGGKTRFGYVIREGLADDAPLLYDLFHPDLLDHKQSLEHYGERRYLGDLVDVSFGIPKIQLARASNEDEVGTTPLVEGRHLLPNGSLNIGEINSRVSVPERYQLQAGDVLLRRIIGHEHQLAVVSVEEHMLPLACADNVIVLRPKLDSPVGFRYFLAPYLRSQLASDVVHAMKVGMSLSPQSVREMFVPVPDEALTLALQSLHNASASFEKWREEAKQAINSLLRFTSPKDERLAILAVGRMARVRAGAVQNIGDFGYRCRTLMPHPIAYRWRSVESAIPNEEGYRQLLDCAEVAVCYLAQMALLLPKSVEGTTISYLTQLSNRLYDTGHGTSMGDWVAILREVRDNKALKRSSALLPFHEVSRFLENLDADDTLTRLQGYRNDFAHGRGPRGSEISVAFDTCRDDLQRFLQAAEFCSEYRLRYIETTRWDSILRVTRYSYRDIMGDHPLVPLHNTETEMAELEAGSLYLVDRHGGLHLMRPLLTRMECPTCNTWATFSLDKYNKRNNTAILKSLEHGHTVEETSFETALRAVGMLPPV
ncbi:MAG: restriction endonuclease subunit S domain-containing protein [Armatimonadota bacterium]